MPAAAIRLAAIRSINALASADSSAILVLANFHRFLNSPEIVQALAKQISTGKQNRTFIVVLSPVVQIPAELEKHFVVLDHDLPGREQLEQIARGIATEDGDLPQGDDLNTVLDAAAGLTRFEAEGAYSLSIVRHGNIRPDAIWELKSPNAKEKRPAAASPRRRAVRRPWRAAIAEELLLAGDAASRPSRSAAASSRGFVAWACPARESPLSPRPSAPKRAGRR